MWFNWPDVIVQMALGPGWDEPFYRTWWYTAYLCYHCIFGFNKILDTWVIIWEYNLYNGACLVQIFYEIWQKVKKNGSTGHSFLQSWHGNACMYAECAPTSLQAKFPCSSAIGGCYLLCAGANLVGNIFTLRRHSTKICCSQAETMLSFIWAAWNLIAVDLQHHGIPDRYYCGEMNLYVKQFSKLIDQCTIYVWHKNRHKYESYNQTILFEGLHDNCLPLMTRLDHVFCRPTNCCFLPTKSII